MKISLLDVKLFQMRSEHLERLGRSYEQVFLDSTESRNQAQTVKVHFVLFVSERVLK